MGGSVHIIKSKAEFDEFVAKGKAEDKPVILDCMASWCGPCKIIAPLFEKLAAEHGDKAYFLKFDVEQVNDLAELLEVTAMPTFIIIRGGQLAARQTGANQDKVKAFVAEAVGAAVAVA